MYYYWLGTKKIFFSWWSSLYPPPPLLVVRPICWLRSCTTQINIKGPPSFTFPNLIISELKKNRGLSYTFIIFLKIFNLLYTKFSLPKCLLPNFRYQNYQLPNWSLQTVCLCFSAVAIKHSKSIRTRTILDYRKSGKKTY